MMFSQFQPTLKRDTFIQKLVGGLMMLADIASQVLKLKYVSVVDEVLIFNEGSSARVEGETLITEV